jgi:gas vesicle protein
MLSTLTEEVDARLGGVSGTVNDRIEHLSEVSTETTDRVAALAESIQKVAEATSYAADHVTGGGGNLQKVLGEIGESARRAGEDVNRAAKSIADERKALRETIASTTGEIREASDEFVSRAASIKGDSNQSVEAIVQAGDRLRMFAEKLKAIYEASTETGRETHQMIEAQTKALKDASQLAIQSATNWSDTTRQGADRLQRISGQVSDQTKRMVAAFEEQANGLIEASAGAQTQLDALGEKRRVDALQSAMRQASFIIETMNALAVDLARMFERDVDDKTWDRYYAGDTGVFIRRIITMREKYRLPVIKKKYLADVNFREAVDRYRAEFEELAKLSQGTGRDELLGPIFFGSDPGKLYALLTHALEE